MVRYPDDPYDRVWIPIIDATDWAGISTTETVQNEYKDLFEAPSKVMQTAITPRDAANSINFHWDSKPQSKGPSLGYIPVFHFADVLQGGGVRQFNININNDKPWSQHYTPRHLQGLRR